jgi:hypothetical protein
LLHLLRRYSYTPTYPAVLTIVHLDGTSILSLYNSLKQKARYKVYKEYKETLSC